MVLTMVRDALQLEQLPALVLLCISKDVGTHEFHKCGFGHS